MDNYREIFDAQRKYLNERRDGEIMQSQARSTARYNPACPPQTVQTHTHEFEASTKLAEEGDDRHNHRFCRSNQ